VALPAVSVLLDYSPNFPTPSAAQRRRSRPASRPAVFGGRRVPPQPRQARLPIPGPTGERAQPHAVHDVVGAEFVRATVSKAGRIRGNESLIALGGSASRRFVRPACHPGSSIMSCLVGEELGFGPVLATAHKPKHPRLLKPGALRACVHLVSVAVTGVLVLLRGLVHHRRLGGTGLQTTTIELSFAQRAVVQRRRHRDQWFPLDAGFVLTDERIGVVGHPCVQMRQADPFALVRIESQVDQPRHR
jgi:hypothetical protein